MDPCRISPGQSESLVLGSVLSSSVYYIGFHLGLGQGTRMAITKA